MLGARHFMSSSDGSLSFQFPNRARSKPNAIRVTLEDEDSYLVQFFRIGPKTPMKELKRYSGVYAEDLMGLFERVTGLRLSLF
jgi:hypothetical protein